MPRRMTLAFSFSLIIVAALCAQQIKRVPVRATPPGDGKAMFTEYCAVCHGAMGRGDGPAAAALAKRPTDLTQLSRQNAGKFPGGQVVRFINGSDEIPAHDTRDMPIWGGVLRSIDQNEHLTEIRIAHLERYVELLQAR
jgi:mono/diheme cytochrome c family protein